MMEFETPFSRPSRQNLAVDTSADSEIARALAENERGHTDQIRFDSDLARRLYEQEAQDRARGADQRGSLRVHGDTEVDRSTGSQLAALPSVQIRPRTNDPLAKETKDSGTQRMQLLEMLETCALEELHVFPDGNCQFRALSDQLFRGQQHHAEVRRQVVQWLRLHPSRYQEYVPQNFADYCQEMAADGTWGDHVTLQAAADCYGVEIRLLTSYESSCVIDIAPQMATSERTLYLSFWAELHYNSVYPAGEVPQQQQHGSSGSGQGREGGGIDVLMAPLKGLNDAIQTVGKHSVEHLKKVPHAVNGIFGEIKNVGERLKGGRKG